MLLCQRGNCAGGIGWFRGVGRGADYQAAEFDLDLGVGAGFESGAFQPFAFEPDADGQFGGFFFDFDYAGHNCGFTRPISGGRFPVRIRWTKWLLAKIPIRVCPFPGVKF